MKETIVIVLLAAMVFLMGYGSGYTNGHIKGMTDQRDLTKRVECEFEYGDVAQSLIPGDCLKYFKEK